MAAVIKNKQRKSLSSFKQQTVEPKCVYSMKVRWYQDHQPSPRGAKENAQIVRSQSKITVHLDESRTGVQFLMWARCKTSCDHSLV